MQALLLSTYELGRQPFGLASPAAWLRRAGWDVTCVDVTKDPVSDATLTGARLIGIHLPMHTATRLAGPLVEKARRLNRTARICAYGLYAPLNETWLRSLGVDEVLGGEFEAELTAIASELAAVGSSVDSSRTPGPSRASSRDAELDPSGRAPVSRHAANGTRHRLSLAAGQSNRQRAVPRIAFLVPDRTGLPPLARYATLQMLDGTRKIVGSTEASRGCKHLCRHCPVVPVYHGEFRIVQPEVVLADIATQVGAGAEHITFGDPDFFNGPTHAMRIVEAMHAAHPALTYDVTVKIEHLLRHGPLLPRLADTGCAFVTSAVESLDDRVLARLEKGHTRADVFEAVARCRAARLTLVPTFVAFHPWLALEDYVDLLDTIARLDLVDHVAPIQLAIRLLLPAGSRLLELDDLQPFVEAFDPNTLSYRWTHPDSRVDRLQREVALLVGTARAWDRRASFDQIRAVAYERAGWTPPEPVPRGPATVPYLNEPWYCCAEPNPEEMRLV